MADNDRNIVRVLFTLVTEIVDTAEKTQGKALEVLLRNLSGEIGHVLMKSRIDTYLEYQIQFFLYQKMIEKNNKINKKKKYQLRFFNMFSCDHTILQFSQLIDDFFKRSRKILWPGFVVFEIIKLVV